MDTTLVTPTNGTAAPAVRRTALRVLLVQVRDQPSALAHEQVCFRERLGVGPEQLTCANVVDEPVPTVAAALAHDVVVLGGAGAHSAYLDYPFTEPLGELLRELVAAGHPFFGSCFGHQFLARALGGSVVADHANEEVGTFDVDLTTPGALDPLFAGYPRSFPVHLGHHDHVAVLPPGVVGLASSGRCRHQVIRVAGKPVYGSQFHCEMSEQHMRERLLMYRDDYMPGDDPLAELDRRLRPTVEVESLLARFVELYT
jgi:GMP synthase (glutamine-hydrolysing)